MKLYRTSACIAFPLKKVGGALKGSKLTIDQIGQKIEFGQNEGLGIYLDGVNLDPDVYFNSFSSHKE